MAGVLAGSMPGQKGNALQASLTSMAHTGTMLLLCLVCTGVLLQNEQIPPAPVQQVALPAGTPLFIRGDARVRMRAGQTVRVHLLFDVYSGTSLALPKGTEIDGEVTSLRPDHAHRVQARLRADFTPFSTPVVRFTRVVLADGRSINLDLEPAHDGAPLLNLAPPEKHKGGFIRQGFQQVVVMAKDRIHVITGPDKRDRFVDLLYTQLPAHPQFIAKGTAWSTETTSAAHVPSVDDAVSRATAEKVQAVPNADSNPASNPGTAQGWIIEANLKQQLNSKDVHAGQAITAVVATPVFNPDGSVAVPEGSVLDGTITKVKAARSFGRGGDLRFDFHQLQLPDDDRKRNVQTSVVGVASTGDSGLVLDSEGGTKPKPKDKLAVPAILFALASRPLDRDRGDHGFGKDAVASNSLGVIGFIVGTAGGWRNVAAGIGYYGTALSIWNRWIKHGSDVNFAKDTRLVLRTSVRRSEPMRPDRN
jgi:hypothetical protein